VHLYIRGGHGDGGVCWKDGEENLQLSCYHPLAIPLWAESILLWE
jgi:hypothetical protein